MKIKITANTKMEILFTEMIERSFMGRGDELYEKFFPILLEEVDQELLNHFISECGSSLDLDLNYEVKKIPK